MDAIHENFGSLSNLAACWNTHLVGQGTLEPGGEATLRLVNADTSPRQMTNAQIDDYNDLPRGEYRWRPPLRLAVRTRFSHGEGQLTGTAGFGFWNDPFMMSTDRRPALPRALWFFYASPPSDMKLALEAPGRGWKAATIDATRPQAWLWAPLAPLLVPLMNLRPLYRRLWPPVQRALGICEGELAVDMTAWHDYVLEWMSQGVCFRVDGDVVLTCDRSPRGPLGFVMWLDNQYMVFKPWGRFGYGLLQAPGRQWLEVDALSIEPGG